MEPGDVTVEELDGKHVERINADGTVVHIKIDRDESVAPGWRYTMHYGLQADADAPLLRYDNDEQPTQHDRHTPDGVEHMSSRASSSVTVSSWTNTPVCGRINETKTSDRTSPHRHGSTGDTR